MVMITVHNLLLQLILKNNFHQPIGRFLTYSWHIMGQLKFIGIDPWIFCDNRRVTCSACERWVVIDSWIGHIPTMQFCLEFPEMLSQNHCIIDWVIKNSKTMHYGILLNTPYWLLWKDYIQVSLWDGELSNNMYCHSSQGPGIYWFIKS